MERGGQCFLFWFRTGVCAPFWVLPRPLTSLLLRTLPVLPRASPWRFPRGQELLVGMHSLDVDTGICPHSCWVPGRDIVPVSLVP